MIKINLLLDVTKVNDLSVDGSTLVWWLHTNKELLTNLLSEGRLSEIEMVSAFKDWLYNQSKTGNMSDVYLWGNGILFDNAKIQRLFRKHDMDYPIFYRNDRDVRTILELASKKTGLDEKQIKNIAANEKETEHNAMDDVSFQIRLVTLCYQLVVSSSKVSSDIFI